MTRRASAAILAIAVVLASAGCAPTVPATATASTRPPTLSSAPATVAPVALPSGSSASSALVAVDRALLALLPVDIGGQALQPDDVTAAEIAATGDLARDIEAIAVGLYIQPGASSADDLAIVNVVRLRPGLFDDGWFQIGRASCRERVL